MNAWIELDDFFMSNNRPGSEDEPTEYYLFTYRCTRQKRGIRRKFCVETLKGSGRDDLDSQLEAFAERPDVIYVGEQPNEYRHYRGEPKRAELGKSDAPQR